MLSYRTAHSRHSYYTNGQITELPRSCTPLATSITNHHFQESWPCCPQFPFPTCRPWSLWPTRPPGLPSAGRESCTAPGLSWIQRAELCCRPDANGSLLGHTCPRQQMRLIVYFLLAPSETPLAGTGLLPICICCLLAQISPGTLPLLSPWLCFSLLLKQFSQLLVRPSTKGWGLHLTSSSPTSAINTQHISDCKDQTRASRYRHIALSQAVWGTALQEPQICKSHFNPRARPGWRC